MGRTIGRLLAENKVEEIDRLLLLQSKLIAEGKAVPSTVAMHLRFSYMMRDQLTNWHPLLANTIDYFTANGYNLQLLTSVTNGRSHHGVTIPDPPPQER